MSGNLSKSETVYHRECHKNIGNITLKRKPDSNDTSEPRSSKRLTCSSVEPFNKFCCFFCQGDMKEDLHEVTTYKKLRTVLEKAKWPHLTIRYNSAIDARAGDFKYHTSCWVKYVDRGR